MRSLYRNSMDRDIGSRCLRDLYSIPAIMVQMRLACLQPYDLVTDASCLLSSSIVFISDDFIGL